MEQGQTIKETEPFHVKYFVTSVILSGIENQLIQKTILILMTNKEEFGAFVIISHTVISVKSGALQFHFCVTVFRIFKKDFWRGCKFHFSQS